MNAHALDEQITLWASATVTALGVADWPAYGTHAWQQLDPSDPRKTAAILTAAEYWRRYGDEQQLLDWFRDANRAPALTLPPSPPLPPIARQVVATPGWPPIQIPGRPGWYRHYIGGRQVDLPTNTRQETAA
ncbi:DUF2742 domain-containing protein [Streptomyces chiangmaiensis]|uniref:DUF2742 domain-containing protein n=1 Tax=Streptomyces chiangmaiensis TaxID=766497 RepID=A0ABU7FSI8_9ACTN|nr:DUF2742 domain-containing protein [Streptomyces chiangmaiensis]MED7826808.1 DUF2742 domain-containing protein [Streptomyces chiangmaiensis]